MRIKYQERDYETRFHNGIGFYDGLPFLFSYSGRNEVSLHKIEPEASFVKAVSVKDDKIDLSSPTLGYVNSQKRCFYVLRRPERRYKQVLHTAVLSYIALGNDVLTSREMGQQQMLSKGFENMLLNIYPSFDEVYTSVKSGKYESRAFDRNIALWRDSFKIIRVFFKQDQIGYIKPDTDEVLVPKSLASWVAVKILSKYNWKVTEVEPITT